MDGRILTVSPLAFPFFWSLLGDRFFTAAAAAVAAAAATCWSIYVPFVWPSVSYKEGGRCLAIAIRLCRFFLVRLAEGMHPFSRSRDGRAEEKTARRTR